MTLPSWANRRTNLKEAEAGALLSENRWHGLGWSVFGFTGCDLRAQDDTQRGFYLRLRFKFDENLF